ncbi:MAG: OpgC domain-containing protein [Alphaproteobacteria bacterium]|nr:OpgC domain-containing protein [Alphaproteobacteria bacterium]
MTQDLRQPVTKRPRDVRLDFFRGLSLFIIYIAHVPGNAWNGFIPARFGFSDAAEVFVFCSGVASAFAFGRVFDERGLAMGTARIAHRCWQVYWVHIAIFFSVLSAMILVDNALGTGNAYVAGLKLDHFVSVDTGTGLVGLLTLTYVPELFDILPMYLIVLTLIPVMMALSRLSPYATLAFMVLLWAVANAGLMTMSAEPWSERPWFFNPFAWQLVFFTGFALVRGWLPPPPMRRDLFAIAVGLLVLMVPIANTDIAASVPLFGEIREALLPVIDKTTQAPLRFAHFLLVAYVAYVLAGPGGVNLQKLGGALGKPLIGVITKTGQQSLSVFAAGILFSMLGGVALNLIGRSFLSYLVVNVAGCVALICVAYLIGWFKSAPWSKPGQRPASSRQADSSDRESTQPGRRARISA